MPWLTLSQAAQRWLTRADWEQRTESGQAESYVDAWGRRRVWVDPQDPVLGALSGLQGELLRLRDEVARLHASLAAAPEPAPAPSAAERGGPAPSPSPAERGRAGVGALPPRSGGLRRLPPPPLPEPEPAAPEPCQLADEPEVAPLRCLDAGDGPSAQVAALLAQVDQRWGGSDRELERRAGLPLRFLTKARRGERNGERAQESWERLETFLRSFRRAA